MVCVFVRVQLKKTPHVSQLDGSVTWKISVHSLLVQLLFSSVPRHYTTFEHELEKEGNKLCVSLQRQLSSLQFGGSGACQCWSILRGADSTFPSVRYFHRFNIMHCVVQ